MSDELREMFDEMMELYNAIKDEVRRRDKHLYDRWHAGGCAVDDGFISAYPHLGEVVESLERSYCPDCGEEMDTDCQGMERCTMCHPCPHCDDGGMDA